MKNTNIFIAIAVILLIFLFWNKKRSKIGYGCAELWDKMENPNAQQVFFDTLSMVDNNASLKASLQEEAGRSLQAYEYLKCLYATQYMVDNSVDNAPLISTTDKAKIDSCICEKDNG